MQAQKVLGQSKLMEHYGDGDLVLMEVWEIIVEQIVHHQFKYLVFHGNVYLLAMRVPWLLKQMEHCGHGVIIDEGN